MSYVKFIVICLKKNKVFNIDMKQLVKKKETNHNIKDNQRMDMYYVQNSIV